MPRRPVIVAFTLVAVVAAVWGGIAWYRASRTVTTDDAYLEGTMAPVSAKVAGQVLEVLVRDNQAVTAGQVIARLDARDYRGRADQARAAVLIAEGRFRAASEKVGLGREMAASQMTQAKAASLRADASRQSATSVLESSRAAASSRRAALASAVAERDRATALRDRADLDLKRARELLAKELVAREFVDHAEVESRSVAAQLVSAEERVAQAQRDLEGAEADARMRESGFEPQQIGLRTAEARTVEARAQAQQAEALVQEVRVREAERELAQAQLKEAQANLSMAELNVEYTVIRAPLDGVVSKKSVEAGQVVQPGQPFVVIVSQTDVWVVANFKETQLRRLRPGMRAEVLFDTYADRAFAGAVESISAGTGSRFSLLPPENATGNWVKVVQRIPVKVVLDATTPNSGQPLRAGMSAVVTVRLR
ncbi:MAG: HlyD family secretion protein [Candidatus Rokubacteria bacterium]|nr:HlyD family secretion protein [Candidatus Rokubacteria bacterium]